MFDNFNEFFRDKSSQGIFVKKRKLNKQFKFKWKKNLLYSKMTSSIQFLYNFLNATKNKIIFHL